MTRTAAIARVWRAGTSGDRAGEGTTMPIFLHSNANFRLPEDPNAPVIMVGPGTGIAPFRAFLEERQADGSKGQNWLFFGEQREKMDFLYKEQLQGMVKDGVLTHLHYAFSRDQHNKVYVQDRIAGEREGGLRVAGARCVLLRLRRCDAHGEGRGTGAAGCDRQGLEWNA